MVTKFYDAFNRTCMYKKIWKKRQATKHARLYMTKTFNDRVNVRHLGRLLYRDQGILTLGL